MSKDSLFIECECSCSEHVLRFTLDPEDEVIYTSVFLHHWVPWYSRVWLAVKYVFGYKCKYGHYDCTLIGKERAEQLKDYCDLLIKNNTEC